MHESRTNRPGGRTTRRSVAIAGIVLGGLAAAGSGFLIRPRRESSPLQSVDAGRVRLGDDLPSLLRAHLDPDGDGWVPRMDTHAMWSRPYMRRGPLPPVPLRMKSLARVGESFVNDIEVAWFGRPVLRVVDAFVEGHGITRIGSRSVIGEEIDQGANLFLWAEALLVPSAFGEGGSVAVEQIGTDEIRLIVPLGAGHDEATVRFAEGHPRRFSALRYKRVGGPKLWWHVDYSEWFLQDGIAVPRRMDVSWEDERRPWLSLELEGFAFNVQAEPRLRQVSHMIEEERAARGL